MLRSLTILQHGLVLVLTAVCLGRSVVTGAPLVPLSLAAVAFVAWYGLGARWAAQARVHDSSSALLPGAVTREVWWLLGLTAAWLALVLVSPTNVWIAFALWLLAGHFLPLRWAIPYTVVVLGVAIQSLWQLDGSLTLPELLGPGIGAVFALFVSRAQLELVRDAVERRRLVESLVAAQDESERLHTELAATQREAGALAERTRLSRDIHDTLAQGFSSIVLLARSAENADDQRVREVLHRIDSTASSNLDEARRVVADLAPTTFESTALAASLNRLLDSLTADTGIATDLRVDGELDGLPTTVEVALLRTVQGALANVRQHSRASRVVVSLIDNGDEVRLDVVDDGVGFDPATRVDAHDLGRGGYGLRSTQARLRELGGGLEIESAPGEGVALSAHLPLSSLSQLKAAGGEDR